MYTTKRKKEEVPMKLPPLPKRSKAMREVLFARPHGEIVSHKAKQKADRQKAKQELRRSFE